MSLRLSPLTVLTALAVLALVPTAHAAPFTPSDDQVVLERLGQRSDPAWRAQRQALLQQPQQLGLALGVARQAIERSRRAGDPRELGVAQAALAPWWRDTAAPASVQLLRATILQSRHAFGPAVQALDGVLAMPGLSSDERLQAWLSRAAVHQVQGRWAAALADCRAMGETAQALGHPARRSALACEAEIESLQGNPHAAAARLAALAGPRGADPWLALLQAELAVRQGDVAGAQRAFAVATRDGDVYSLAAHADFLLEQGDAQGALTVLARGPQEADALLLRRALAWARLGDGRGADAARVLRERFAAARARGDAPHYAEEARLALVVDGDPARALSLATQQWAVQREPADAVLLWRAARAAGRPLAARVLHDWVPDPARADVRLQGLPGGLA